MTDSNNTATWTGNYTNSTTTASSWTYHPTVTHIERIGQPIYIGRAFVPSIVQEPKKGKVKRMDRGLFLVYIVDPATDEVVHETGAIVAKDEDNAQLKAVRMAGGTLTKDIDDYDIVVVELGDVRDKKTVQEVKVIKD